MNKHLKTLMHELNNKVYYSQRSKLGKKCLKDQLNETDDNRRFIINDRITRREMNEQIRLLVQETKVLKLEKSR
jgi:hypothetical protein